MLVGVSGNGLTCIATGSRDIANHSMIGKLGLPSAVRTLLFLYILLDLIHWFSLIRQVRPVWIVAMKMKITATHVEKMVTWSAVIRARWFSIKHVISHLLGTYHGKVMFASRTRSTHITWLVLSLVHWITFFDFLGVRGVVGSVASQRIRRVWKVLHQRTKESTVIKYHS